MKTFTRFSLSCIFMLCTLATTYVYADGTGADGALNITSVDFNINTDTQQSGRAGLADAVNFVVTNTVNAGVNTVTLTTAPTGLAVGNEILIINLKGISSDYSNVGNYETKIIASINDTDITFTSPLSNTYGNAFTGQRIMLQRVPNYTDVTIASGRALTVNPWNGSKSGVLFFRATGTVQVDGTINLTGKGFNGGSEISYGTATGGETYNGAAGTGSSGTGQGGGGGGNGTTGGGAGGIGAAGGGGGIADNGSSAGGGGGGGYGTSGTGGTGYYGVASSGGTGQYATGGNGGAGYKSGLTPYGGGGGGGGTVGVQEITKLYLGSGGGSGNRRGTIGGAGAGGKGGGIIYIIANIIKVNGLIQNNGNNGASVSAGGGGGGSGGSIYLKAISHYLGISLVTATGGSGGTGNYAGGAGGVGRIRLDYVDSIAGTTNPVAYAYQDFYLISGNVVTTTEWTDLINGKSIQMGQSIAHVKFNMQASNDTVKWKKFRIDKGVKSFSNIACPDSKIEVQIWCENNNNGFWDSSDTFISKGNFTNGTCWLNMKRWQVTTQSRTYYIVWANFS
ncbi:MAG: hypothetical protein HY811_06660 [Planctomycetes bacterium]|nr:hypothetical protein [Planctomycetota bacterium]